MPVFLASIASGSNGNCYYIGNNDDAVLIDAGISCRETERRMSRLGLTMAKVRAIFISHEHTDHIRGLEVLSRKYKLPVYITPRTLRACSFTLDSSLVKNFRADEPVSAGSISVIPFKKKHDAIDPHSFIAECEGVTTGIITDIGTACSTVTSYFKRCHAAFLETNYDHDMLMNGRYPHYLKKRISGGHGHISNAQALQLVREHGSKKLRHIFLSHLSKENNDPLLAQSLFQENIAKANIIIASRYQESELIEMETTIASRAIQMSLF